MRKESSFSPSIAVCLAAFNGQHWLPEQMSSILGQKGVSVTIFVSVDASSDGTEAWIDAAAQADSRIIVLPHGEKFGGAAQNFFRLLQDVDFSRFDYVSFSDQDDLWQDEKLFRAHQVLEKTQASAYSSNVIAFWPSGRQMMIKKSQPQQPWDFLFEAAGPGCTYVMRPELINFAKKLLSSHQAEMKKIGLHDWFMYALARGKGLHWVIDDYAGIFYRQHAENQVGVNRGWHAFLNRARRILNGWGLSQSILIAQLVGVSEDPFVKRWSHTNRAGLLWLAFHAGQCRRKAKDKVLFALSCVALFVFGESRS